MKYDPKTETLTLDNGQRAHRSVVEAVVGDVMDGRAVLVLPCADEGKLWYVARKGTDVDGRSIVAKSRVEEGRLLRRVLRVLASWAQRQAPVPALEDCTYPRCGCRAPAGGGPVACAPRASMAAEMGLAPADEIAPPCGACGLSIRVGAAEDQSGSAVYQAVCSDPDCGWRALVVVTTRVDGTPRTRSEASQHCAPSTADEAGGPVTPRRLEAVADPEAMLVRLGLREPRPGAYGPLDAHVVGFMQTCW